MPKSIQSPGSVIKLFLRGYQLNPTSLAKQLQLSQATVRLLTLDKTKISVQVALRLAKFFSMKPEYWLKLQNDYDLAMAVKNAKLNKVVKAIPRAKKPTAAELKSGAAKAKRGPKAKAAKGGKAAKGAKTGAKPRAAKGSRAGAKRGRKAAKK
jgi:addiction module HigA family antidote